eukprot:3105258-Pyramimonas_sp.AAC.1
MGRELSWRCKGQRRHMELTGGGRTHRSEVYPDKLYRAILKGLVEQMKIDGRQGGAFKEEDSANMEVDEEGQREMQINETNSACDHADQDREHKH